MVICLCMFERYYNGYFLLLRKHSVCISCLSHYKFEVNFYNFLNLNFFEHQLSRPHFKKTIFQVERTDWVLQWPGQIVIAGCQTYWTTEVSEALEEGNLDEAVDHFKTQVC